MVRFEKHFRNIFFNTNPNCYPKKIPYLAAKLAVAIFTLCIGVGTYAGDTNNFTTIRMLTNKKIIQEDGIRFVIIPKKGISKNSLGVASTESLILGYPMELVGQGMMFGGVVTKVSDKEDETLGGLKLATITAVVTPELINTSDKQVLTLKGQYWESGEGEKAETIVDIPVTEVDQDKKLVYLDLAALGEQLNIAQYLKNFAGEDVDQFTHIQSKTVAVDFSLKTLIFDVASDYIIKTKIEGTENFSTRNVTLTTRWFLRLNSGNSPFFERRKNTEGVGFFTTGDYNPNGDKFGWISRFPIHDLKNNPVKYYVKNVPREQRAAMLSGFEDWNHKLQNTLGHDLLVYEFIEKEDPRYEQIIPGDVRYNVLEWDIDNKASYGGLGPSLKNALTGEVMAGQVLIQGPTILGIYKNWFNVKEQSQTLRSKKQFALAKQLENQFLKKLFVRQQKQLSRKMIQITFGKTKFHIPSQDPNLKDLVAIDPLDYLATPEGYTYETYMNGYWREITAHELGHNLGLRHNFRGNLKDTGAGTVSSVSWSVMEYLPRTHRHLNRVSEYDIMAIAYGYLGKMPEVKDRFCTDGDQAIYSFENSAECSNADATNDPISFFDQRINRGLDLLLARNSAAAPELDFKDIWGTMNPFLKHLAAYAYSAPFTADKWTNFFGKEGRPETVAAVPQYILEKLNGYICGESLDKEILAKTTSDAQVKAQANLNAYRAAAFALLKKVPAPWSLVNKQNFTCYAE